MTDRSTATDDAPPGPDRTVTDVTADLAVANLRTVVAITLAQLAGDLVESNHDLQVVAADVVTCWRQLTPEARQVYIDRHANEEDGLVDFASEYCTAVDTAWFADTGDGHAAGQRHEDMCLLSWTIHVAQIHQRVILGRSPEAAWLRQFPLPEDRMA